MGFFPAVVKIANSPSRMTSMYVGEEGGGSDPIGGGGMTSMYVGEEGGCEVTPMPGGKDGGGQPELDGDMSGLEQLLQLFIRDFCR